MRKRSLIAQQPIEEEKRNLLPLNINKRGKYDLDSLFNNTPVFDEAPMSFGKQLEAKELWICEKYSNIVCNSIITDPNNPQSITHSASDAELSQFHRLPAGEAEKTFNLREFSISYSNSLFFYVFYYPNLLFRIWWSPYEFWKTAWS